jgi:hypothetical protein
LTWMSVGADVKNGLWAMFGACEGCHKTMLEDAWDYTQVRDFTYLDDLWNNSWFPKWKDNPNFDLEGTIDNWIESLNYSLGINAARLDAEQSKFFKFCKRW